MSRIIARMFRKSKICPERTYVIQYLGSVEMDKSIYDNNILTMMNKAFKKITKVDADGLLSTLTISPEKFTFKINATDNFKEVSYTIINIAGVGGNPAGKCCCYAQEYDGSGTVHIFYCHLSKSFIEQSELAFDIALKTSKANSGESRNIVVNEHFIN